MASPTVIDAAWTFDDQNTAQNGRYVMGALFQNAAASTVANSAWRDGVLPGVYSNSLSAYMSLRVSENSPTGSSVLVQPGHAVVTRTGQGLYVCPNSTARVVTLDAADATNPRIDLIVLQVLDQPLGDSVTQVQVRAVSGTPSGSPVAPALPTGAIPLARVAVAAAPTGNTIVNANITDLRKSAGIQGTIRPLLAGDLVTDAGVPGDLRFDSNLFSRYTNSGGGLWQPYAQVNQGFGYVANATFNANGGTHPTGAEFVGRSITFNALANRRYKATWLLSLSALGGGADIKWFGRWATGGSITTASTEIYREKDRYLGGVIQSHGITCHFTGPATAQAITTGITVQNVGGGDTVVAGSADYINHVLVEDIGGV